MIVAIAQKDFREFVRYGRIAWTGGTIVVLLFAALLIGFHHESGTAEQRAQAEEESYESWLTQEAKNPHDAAHQGVHVFKPKTGVALIDPGLEPYVGVSTWLQAHFQADVRFRPADDTTGLQRFGSLSIAWVLQTLVPLLIIVLGFGAFSAEREQGTLRQALSMGVRPGRLLCGKAGALVSTLALLLVPLALLFAVLVVREATHGANGDLLLRLGWMGLSYAFYFGFFIFVTLAVSAFCRSSRVSLILLLAFWIAVCMIAPRAASDLSRFIHPAPSRFEFIDTMMAEFAASRARIWEEHFGTAQYSDLSLDTWGAMLNVDDASGYQVFDRHYGNLWDTFERQQRFQDWGGLIAPVLALRSFSMSMAGTDFHHHRDFMAAAEGHRRMIQDVMSEDLMVHADPRQLGYDYKAGEELWRQVPPFDYRTPSSAWAIAKSGHNLAILGGALVLAAVLALLGMRRLRAA